MFEFELQATSGAARAGRLHLPHGRVATPAFMPVGTNGSVRALSPDDLRAAGAGMILSNTYHLHVRPGENVVRSLGGLHRFMAWDGPILTDSGGFQVFSLDELRRLDEDGVEFRSPVDGSLHRLTPESAMDIQWALGSDVAMAFDHVVPGNAEHAAAADAVERTARWLGRCRTRHSELTAGQPPRQTLWPIIQGATFPDLRIRSLELTRELGDWTGVAIGGLAVGETRAAMQATLEALEPQMPRALPRYLMGVGFPEDLLESIARGIDLFDCVAPTRNGRNGQAFTRSGRLNIRNAAHRVDSAPIEEGCDCEACCQFSRGYIRHLFAAGELLGLRLLSLHNVRFLIRLCEEARKHIIEGEFTAWYRDWLANFRSEG